ncbi:MAG: phosphodiester glycosidase family protein [Bacteroidales bacterium]|jgi:exopolysaccharide biosynthesis protein|nr:phosphodiester glycosidase family protein [Bacteroidales bacterium]
MKRFATVLLLLCSVYSYSQNDSIILKGGEWSRRVVSPGITHHQVHFSNNELFSSSQFINIIEIEFGYKRVIGIIPSPVLKETSLLAKEAGAVAAINGSFFKFNYEYNTVDYNSVDYIRKEGKELAPNTYTGSSRAMHQRGALALYDGELYILKADELKDWERYIQAQEVLTSGPLLRVAGRDESLENSSFYTTRHPRTAVAKLENGNILLFTVDGRAESSLGMTLEELQKTLRWLGARDIINLDGGGSTTMFIDGSGTNGVVNHPTDNRKFDNMGERKVANIVFVR